MIDPSPPEKISRGGPAFEEELRAPLGDGRVVTAQNENDVGAGQLMIQLMVTPDLFRQPAYAIVHLAARCFPFYWGHVYK